MDENTAALLRQSIEARLEQVHTWLPATIVEFDAQTLRATVQPTIKKVVGPTGQETKLPYPLILEVPVDCLLTEAFVIRPPYKADDTVTIGFYERSIEEILKDIEQRDPQFSRKHHLTDALVVQGRMTDTEGQTRPLPSGWTTELIIHRRQTGTAIRLDRAGNIGIQVDTGKNVYLGPNVINGSMEGIAVDGAILGTRHKAWVDNHVHSCSGCAGVTHAPTTKSPEVSETVLIGE